MLAWWMAARAWLTCPRPARPILPSLRGPASSGQLPTLGALPDVNARSVADGLREHVHDHDPGEDQAQADDGGEVERLPEPDRANGSDEHDPQPTPDRVDDADRDRPEGQRQQVKGDAVTDHGDERWH